MVVIAGILLILLLLGYAFLIEYYLIAWEKIPVFNAPGEHPSLGISVLVPARNEEKCIASLLQALMNQDYPATLFEVIVIDDQSADDTVAIVQRFPAVRLLRLTEDMEMNGKKAAIAAGVEAARFPFILTTDADCSPGPSWLRYMAACKEQTKARCIAGPVLMEHKPAVLQVFQRLDFQVLQGITGAALSKGLHPMGNGANLGYEKAVFDELRGFEGIDHIASGDDILLLNKIAKKYPGEIVYLKAKEAIVRTPAENTWSGFLRQRIRWASKALHYKSFAILAIMWLVYLFNLSFPVLIIASFSDPVFWNFLAILLLSKIIIELPFVYTTGRFFDLPLKHLFSFILLQPLHILYTLVSGLFGQSGRYEWKGRKVK